MEVLLLNNPHYKMNKYTQDIIANVKIENVEGSSISEQISYFIGLLENNPHIKRIVEIGFNLGISAAAFLSSRHDIEVISVDIGCHPYVLQAKEQIDMNFPGRHRLIIGNSKDAIPFLHKELAWSPDMIFIDGDHRAPMPQIDIENCLRFASQETLLILDDVCEAHGCHGVIQALDGAVQKQQILLLKKLTHNDRGWALFKKLPTPLKI
jgi:predicted O-methyltransferase YrrM